MDHPAYIDALHPNISCAIVKQTEISAISWKRIGQSKSRRQKLTSDTKSLGVGINLELSAGEPCAIHGKRQSAKIAVAKNRSVQDIDRFVVETFKDRT
jgi:hypothetical protein